MSFGLFTQHLVLGLDNRPAVETKHLCFRYMRDDRGRGGTAPVTARPQPMVAGGRVLGEDGRGRAVTGPPFPINVFTETVMLSCHDAQLILKPDF